MAPASWAGISVNGRVAVMHRSRLVLASIPYYFFYCRTRGALRRRAHTHLFLREQGEAVTNLWEYNFLTAGELSTLAGASRGFLPFCPLGKWAGVIAFGTAGIIPRLNGAFHPLDK